MSRAAVEGYTGEGEPPCIVMTLIAINKTVSTDANFTVTLDGVQPPNTITITRSSDPANLQMEASTVVGDRFSYENCETIYVLFIQSVELKMSLTNQPVHLIH